MTTEQLDEPDDTSTGLPATAVCSCHRKSRCAAQAVCRDSFSYICTMHVIDGIQSSMLIQREIVGDSRLGKLYPHHISSAP